MAAAPAERARHEAAFAQFAAVFPDAFYITERARVYLDAAMGDPLRDFFRRYQGTAGLILALICLYRLSDFVLNIMNPFYRDMGFSLTEIAEVRKEEGRTRNVGGSWHTDQVYRTAPSWGTMLLCRELPETGGDTLFASMAAAYERLSDGLKQTLESLRAVHSNAGVQARMNTGRAPDPDGLRVLRAGGHRAPARPPIGARAGTPATVAPGGTGMFIVKPRPSSSPTSSCRPVPGYSGH